MMELVSEKYLQVKSCKEFSQKISIADVQEGPKYVFSSVLKSSYPKKVGWISYCVSANVNVHMMFEV